MSELKMPLIRSALHCLFSTAHMIIFDLIKLKHFSGYVLGGRLVSSGVTTHSVNMTHLKKTFLKSDNKRIFSHLNSGTVFLYHIYLDFTLQL